MFMINFRRIKLPPIKKRINRKFLFVYSLLIISFLLIVLCSLFYIKNNTNFIEQGINLLSEKEQTISNNLLLIWIIGVIFFGISIFFLRDVGKVFLFFIWEFLLIIASALFLIGALVPDLKWNFKLLFILSAFIIYYSVFEAKQILEGVKKNYG